MKYDVITMASKLLIMDTESKTIIGEIYEQDDAQTFILNQSSFRELKVIQKAPKLPPIEIKVNNDPTVPDFYVTGIKEKDGVKLYKTRYVCFNCSEKGKHYLPEGTTHINCHNCQFEIPVKSATPLGFPNRDEYGNFYVALPPRLGGVPNTKQTFTSSYGQRNY